MTVTSIWWNKMGLIAIRTILGITHNYNLLGNLCLLLRMCLCLNVVIYLTYPQNMINIMKRWVESSSSDSDRSVFESSLANLEPFEQQEPNDPISSVFFKREKSAK